MVRFLMALVLLCAAAGLAYADGVKGYGDAAMDGRQGGESWADAVVIPQDLPYSDTGATCDNVNDVDFSCGYTAGLSPDVFYSYTACVTGSLSVSLCGSEYDTELAIFDEGHNELYCNDDFCGLQSEIDDIAVTEGSLYYIVVSGYYGGCGSYTMTVVGPACPVPVANRTWSQIKKLY